MSQAEKQFDRIQKFLRDVELCESLGISEDGFADEVLAMIQKYSQLVEAESIEKALLSDCVVAETQQG
ncbi:hypothetical protein [Limosilactobacillus antri]|uniref:hypothetical protein n=1 Tax=Limosilactobacillus antri TaxID=227943 RepID=UPI001F58BB44|nr:hypothetical protein [Limosilactobacillus antri]